MKIYLPLVMLLLSACSARIESTGSEQAPEGWTDDRVLPQSTGKLAGTVKGQAWSMGNAVAIYRNGEYSINISSAGEMITCTNYMSPKPHISFLVPNEVASHFYDGSAGGRLVNFIFPYHTANGGGADNILASKSNIQIQAIQDGFVQGNVAALSPQGESLSYSIAGSFAAKVCDGPAAMIQVQYKGATAFNPAYMEAIKMGDGRLEVRVMDKIPQRKCNNWTAWMMTEVPIKYFTILVPQALGAIMVQKGVAEYGSQGTSSGWSSDNFEGNAKVLAVDAKTIRLTLDTKDAYNSIVSLGQISASICE